MEDEVVVAAGRVAGLAAAALAAAAALRALDLVAAHVVGVAGVHDLAMPARAMAEHRLGDVALRDVHVLAALHVADAAAVDGALDRFADLLLVTPQEALAVADRLVLARKPPVDDLLDHGLLPSAARGAAHELFLTRRYHSHSSLTCLGV